MSRIEGSTILITGAGSGLGRGMAARMAARGGRLVLWDIDPRGLEGTAEAVRAAGGGEPACYVCDVSSREAIYETAGRVGREVGPVDILINNAGIVSGRPFLECTDEQVERTMRVNAMALFWTARAFLPGMIERRRGHVVTIASSAGFVGVARLVDYCASKWAAVGFAESLRVEFRKYHPFLRSTVVCPYYINTGMFEGVKTRFPWLLPILDKDVVVRRIVRAIERDRAQLVMPWLVRTVPLVKFLPPRAQDWIFDFLGINHSMDDFVGRR
ncbi:MAG: SDR family NAD(P)-dependent oxidoreductase [Acidobacteria bacterium]|nr:MAG: SDR family NAD(P)-dependent oxidoreductase [Acidobacteriota bacterium]